MIDIEKYKQKSHIMIESFCDKNPVCQLCEVRSWCILDTLINNYKVYSKRCSYKGLCEIDRKYYTGKCDEAYLKIKEHIKKYNLNI